MKYVIGVDLGGTFIKAGAVSAAGRVLSRVQIHSRVVEGRKVMVDAMAEASERALREAGLTRRQAGVIGLGVPGLLTPNRSMVIFSPNLLPLNNTRLPALLARRLGLPASAVQMENDANVAALAEYWVGESAGCKSLALFTLGTGIGGGLVLDGKLWRGDKGLGGELGHQTLLPDGPLCGCGNRGCLEALASATALVRRFGEAIRAGRKSPLARSADEAITAAQIAHAAKKGDALCRNLIAETGRYLGIAATNVVHMLNVESVVYAGGMTGAGRLLLDPILAEVKRRAMAPSAEGVRISFSKLGPDAGMIGSAAWALFGKRGAKKK